MLLFPLYIAKCLNANKYTTKLKFERKKEQKNQQDIHKKQKQILFSSTPCKQLLSLYDL